MKTGSLALTVQDVDYIMLSDDDEAQNMDEDQKAAYAQWKQQKDQQTHQQQEKMFEQKIEEYEMLYANKMRTSKRFLNSSVFKAMPKDKSPIILESPREKNKYKLEMRVFDGNLNETRDQAINDF